MNQELLNQDPLFIYIFLKKWATQALLKLKIWTCFWISTKLGTVSLVFASGLIMISTKVISSWLLGMAFTISSDEYLHLMNPHLLVALIVFLRTVYLVFGYFLAQLESAHSKVNQCLLQNVNEQHILYSFSYIGVKLW